MSEILPVFIREAIAQKVDAHCGACQRAPELENALHFKNEAVNDILALVILVHKRSRLDISPFAKACVQACNACWNSGRTGDLSTQKSCGIRTETYIRFTK